MEFKRLTISHFLIKLPESWFQIVKAFRWPFRPLCSDLWHDRLLILERKECRVVLLRFCRLK